MARTKDKKPKLLPSKDKQELEEVASKEESENTLDPNNTPKPVKGKKKSMGQTHENDDAETIDTLGTQDSHKKGTKAKQHKKNDARKMSKEIEPGESKDHEQESENLKILHTKSPPHSPKVGEHEHHDKHNAHAHHNKHAAKVVPSAEEAEVSGIKHEKKELKRSRWKIERLKPVVEAVHQFQSTENILEEETTIEVREDPRISQKRQEMKRAKCYELYQAKKMRRAKQLKRKMKILKGLFTADNFMKWIARERKIKEELQEMMSLASEIPSEAPSDVSSVQLLAPPTSGVEVVMDPGQQHFESPKPKERRLSKKNTKGKRRKSDEKKKLDTFIVIKPPPKVEPGKNETKKENVKTIKSKASQKSNKVDSSSVTKKEKKVSFDLESLKESMQTVKAEEKKQPPEGTKLNSDKLKSQQSSLTNDSSKGNRRSLEDGKSVVKKKSMQIDKERKKGLSNKNAVKEKNHLRDKSKSESKIHSSQKEKSIPKRSSLEKGNSNDKKWSLGSNQPGEKKRSLQTDERSDENKANEFPGEASDNYEEGEGTSNEEEMVDEMINTKTVRRKKQKSHPKEKTKAKRTSKGEDVEKTDDQTVPQEIKVEEPQRYRNYQEKIHIQIRYNKWKYFDELPHNIRLGQLKSRIFMFTRIEPYKQKLYFKGRKLRDNRKTIAEYIIAPYAYNSDNPAHFHLKYRNDCVEQEELEAAAALLPEPEKEPEISPAIVASAQGKSETVKATKDATKIGKSARAPKDKGQPNKPQKLLNSDTQKPEKSARRPTVLSPSNVVL